MSSAMIGRLSYVGSVQHQGVHKVVGVLANGNVWVADKQNKHGYSTSSITDMKRGRGGRSSFSGIVTTVFGANGLLGRSLVNRLGKIGSQVIVPYRSDPYLVRDLKLMGDLGQILFMPFHLEDEESIRKAVRYSNIVVNLIGKTNETRNFSFQKLHVDGAARIARISKEEGVEKFIHVSALNCKPNPEPKVFPGGSKYLRSKFDGEVAVQAEFPEAVIFRPADMWGQLDKFVFYYCSRYRRFRFDDSKVSIPLWKKGLETVKQPVYVGNVAEGIIKAIQDPDCEREIIEAVGPNRYKLHDLIRWFYAAMRFEPSNVLITDIYFYFKLKLIFNELVQPVYPPISRERLEVESHTDKLTGESTLEDYGVKLVRLEDRLHWELRHFRQYGYYWDALGEFPLPPDPPVSTDSPYATS